MVAKTLQAHNDLTEQLQERTILREYHAIAHGRMIAGGTVDEPIGRHPTDRLRYAVRDNGKEAVTHYRVIERFKRHTHIQVKLETGRTHQIRVHMKAIGHPIVHDTLYAPKGQNILGFERMALHSFSIDVVTPSQKVLHIEAPLPEDFKKAEKMLGDVA